MNPQNITLCALAGATLLAPGQAAVVENASVRIETVEDGLRVRLSVRDGAGWRPVLESAPGDVGGINTLGLPISDAGHSLAMTGQAGGASVVTVLMPGTQSGHVRVVSRLRFTEPTEVEAIVGRWRFLGGAPDTTWTPNLTPEPGQVIGQHAFRSPAILFQKETLAAILLPNVETLAGNPHALPATMNLDVETDAGPTFQMALMPHHTQGHVYWRHDAGHTLTVGPGEVTLDYELLLSATAEPGRAYRLAARWWWDAEGTKHLRGDTLPQAVPWKRYVEVGYDDYLPVVWRETEMNGEAVGGAAMPVLASRNATWFQCWFNDLRSAYGEWLWGKWTDRPELVEKARKTRQLLLNAPRKDGLFPVIYDWDRHRWIGSSGPGVGGGEDIYHIADMAWAAYWLLMWHRDLEPSPRSVAFARDLGDWMVKAQKASGEIPAYLHMDTMQPTDRLVGGAETAADGMFLALLARETGEAKYMAAARKAAGYVRREIMPTNKWYDYETFYSCARKPETFMDHRTGQRPQNTLSMHWAAEMFRQLYLADRRPEDLADGEALMDYVNLYQQAWAPTFLTFEGFGGYGVQNTDAEWNDARQAQFASTNVDFYRLTGKPEYLERAIAALRAGFATTYMPENAFISPGSYDKTPLGHADENYGHGGVDAPAIPTSFDWGTGSALTAVAYARRAFGDVWVDGNRALAFGINGVTATLRGNEMDLRTSTQTVAPVLVRGMGEGLPARLVINGDARAVSAKEWRDGFLATPRADARIRHRAPILLTADDTAIEFEVWPHGAADASVAVDGKTVPAQRIAEGRWKAALPVPAASAGRRRVAYSITADGAERAAAQYETEIVTFGAESPLWTERFTASELPARWTSTVPVSGPVVRPGEGLVLAVPGDRKYDQWVPQNDAPRVTTPVPEGDWAFTAVLDTRRTPRRGAYHAALLLELGDNDYAFYGPSMGESVVLERSGQNLLAVSTFGGAMPPEIEVRARQTGDTLWFDWRPAGGAWSRPATLTAKARRAGFLLKTWEEMPAEITVREARMGALSPAS